MVTSTPGIRKEAYQMVRAHVFGGMGRNTQEVGELDFIMAKEFSHPQMETFTWEASELASKMDMVKSSG